MASDCKSAADSSSRSSHLQGTKQIKKFKVLFSLSIVAVCLCSSNAFAGIILTPGSPEPPPPTVSSAAPSVVDELLSGFIAIIQSLALGVR